MTRACALEIEGSSFASRTYGGLAIARNFACIQGGEGAQLREKGSAVFGEQAATGDGK